MNLVPNKQMLVNVRFQSTNYRKIEICVDKKVQETIGDVYCPTCRNEKCVYISIDKTTSFYDCKKCKTCCHVLNTRFMYQKPTHMLFDGDATHCFARITSRDYEFQLPLTSKEHIKRETKYVPVWGLKPWTLAAIN